MTCVLCEESRKRQIAAISFRTVLKVIFQLFLSLARQDVTLKISDGVELKIHTTVDFIFLRSTKR